MKKLIAAIDSLKYSESTAEYALHFAKEMNAHLIGVLLEDHTYHSYKIFEAIGTEGVSVAKMEKLEHKDQERRRQAAMKFESTCRRAGINHSVHHNTGVALNELLYESLYADVIVVNREETLTHYEEKAPSRFIRDLLGQAECPVLLVPHEYGPITKIKLLYDGEPSSVFAIRMFSYLFPSLKRFDTEVISVKYTGDSTHVPDNRLMKEFTKRHYPEAKHTVLHGEPETEIVNHLKDDANHSLVVLGAYRRGVVSRWFRPSMADVLIHSINAPLFVAHK